MSTDRLLLAALLLLAACTPTPASDATVSLGGGGPHLVPVQDSVVAGIIEASGVAAPRSAATLSTRLMGAVTAVLVQEGDRVRAGQLLLRLDTRELLAKGDQASAALRAAEAMAAEAELYAGRIRALYADSAAPKATLDAAETGVVRARAAVAQARGAGAEVAAISGYGELRAPFAGVITRRWVDPGAFATPGAPLLTVEDDSRLRITVSTTPLIARTLRAGTPLAARIEDVNAVAIVEGVVPMQGGGLYTINAIVPNHGGKFLSGGAATLLIPSGSHRALLVPRAAIARQGDLTGVRVWEGERSELRWVRLGEERGELVEALSGLSGRESIVQPPDMEGN